MRSLSKAEDRVELRGCWATALGIIGLLMTTQDPSLTDWLPVAITLFTAGTVLIIGANIPRAMEHWAT